MGIIVPVYFCCINCMSEIELFGDVRVLMRASLTGALIYIRN